MPKQFLFDYQRRAVDKMFNGCILNGGVGSGKSRTGLYYYFKEHGGSIDPYYIPMKNPRDLYIITTAKNNIRNKKVYNVRFKSLLNDNHLILDKYKFNLENITKVI